VSAIASATGKKNALTGRYDKKKAKYNAIPIKEQNPEKLSELTTQITKLEKDLQIEKAKKPEDQTPGEIKKLEAEIKKKQSKIDKYNAETNKLDTKKEKRQTKLNKLVKDISAQTAIITYKQKKLNSTTLSEKDIDAKRIELDGLNDTFRILTVQETAKKTELTSQLKLDADRKQAIVNSIEGKIQNNSTKLTRKKLEYKVKKTKKKMKRIRRKMEIRRKSRKREEKRKRKQEQYNKSLKKGGILRALGLRGLWEGFSKKRYKSYRANTSTKSNEELGASQGKLRNNLIRLGETSSSDPDGNGGPAPGGPVPKPSGKSKKPSGPGPPLPGTGPVIKPINPDETDVYGNLLKPTNSVEDIYQDLPPLQKNTNTSDDIYQELKDQSNYITLK
jgi:hypothetical protein